MSEKKKILFVITYLQMGGAQKQLLSFIDRLPQSRYSLSLISSDRGYLKKEFLKRSFLKVKLIKQLVRRVNPLLDAAAFFRIYFYIKKHKFDMVHVHSPKASVLGRWAAFFAGVKLVVYTVHGWPFHDFSHKFQYLLYLAIEKITAKITSSIIVVSQRDFDKTVKAGVAGKNKISLIHYGIEVKKFNRIAQKRQLSGLKPLILNISALKPQKGLRYFFEAAGKLKNNFSNFRFLVAGDGPLRKEYQKYIEKEGLEETVLLKGWIDDLSFLLEKCHIFVLTSLWEGLPVALIEAVISGIPVLVTDNGALSDIIENDAQGLVIKPAGADAVCSGMKKILGNYSYWFNQAKEGQKLVNLRYWSIKRMAEETEKLYRDLFSRC